MSEKIVCYCNNISKRHILKFIKSDNTNISDLNIGNNCGACLADYENLLLEEKKSNK